MAQRTIICLLLAVAALIAAMQAQDSSSASALEAVRAISSAVEPASPSKPNHSPIFQRDGFWLSTANSATQLHVHGYAQADDRMFSANIHGEQLDTFLFRRIRPLFEGTVFKAVDFRFMPDFGQNNAQIQEAFLELKTLPFAKLRVGKFKEPIGLEVLRQDRDLTFIERSLASDLVPLRYIGAQLSGTALSDSITYQAGYFDGSSDGSNGTFTQWTHSNEAAARAFLRPLAKSSLVALQNFGIGVGGSAGTQHGAIAGLKTIGQATFFKYSSSTVADGQHNRLAPQAYYYAGPFGLIGEYAISSQAVFNKRWTARIRNQAWQIAGSILITGEKNGYTGVRGRNAFEPRRGFGHFGALELALRYSQVRIDGNAFSHFANPAAAARFAGETGVAFNWYLTRYIKLQTDFEHTTFRMAAGGTVPLHTEDLLLSQIQLAF